MVRRTCADIGVAVSAHRVLPRPRSEAAPGRIKWAPDA
ncbi:hypothetical protein BRPE64_ACDS13530 [Caballeronia insecticola]|uniref:Uncharacterized protein n=1 Tax=Caballeronia insecticola TaxID=758793 RepID=R4WY63_9BURK|nr:hypothetical protein BRPE64_ACDS13530 [Caballeronia insecticola]